MNLHCAVGRNERIDEFLLCIHMYIHTYVIFYTFVLCTYETGMYAYMSIHISVRFLLPCLEVYSALVQFQSIQEAAAAKQVRSHYQHTVVDCESLIQKWSRGLALYVFQHLCTYTYVDA